MTVYSVFYDSQRVELFEQEIKPLLLAVDCEYIPYDSESSPKLAANSRVLTWLKDDDLYLFLPLASTQQWQVGLIPHPDMNIAYRTFTIPKKPEEAIADIMSVEAPVPVDLMYCNELLVLGSVMIGDPTTMEPASRVDEHFWRKLIQLVVLTFRLSKLRLWSYTLHTAKENTIHSAALGIVIVYRPSGSDFTKWVVGETPKDEANLNAIILAPRSIAEIVRFLASRIFPKHKSHFGLASYLGHIKTQSLMLSCHKPFGCSVNGNVFSAEQIKVSVQSDALQVLSSFLPEKLHSKDQKESVRTAGLPKGQAVTELIISPLPWIHHAEQEEVTETFVTLKEHARVSESYLVLMILATLLATFGLFANSAPVIIGAMILAPLMSPIISLSMGVLRQDIDLIIVSSKSLATGVVLALVFATLLTLLMPLQMVNNEISARLSPTILDLGVAIISGIAGAYAHARSEVAKSLAGVAIAVALVPPLSVAGIGIGWLDWHVFWGAFLLFTTNLVGIVLAAAATFLLLGFSPFRLAKKGITIALVFAALVSVPLTFSFSSMVDDHRIIYQLEGAKFQGILIKDVSIRSGSPQFVVAKLLADKPLQAAQIDLVKQDMEGLLGHKIRLEATMVIVR